jgi:hypothetical protein
MAGRTPHHFASVGLFRVLFVAGQTHLDLAGGKGKDPGCPLTQGFSSHKEDDEEKQEEGEVSFHLMAPQKVRIA